MNCTACKHYSYPLRRCKLGKINPKTIKGGVEAVRFMGPSYICTNCALWEKIMDRWNWEVASGQTVAGS